MRALQSRTLQFVAIAALAGAAPMDPGPARAYTPEQEQACTGDAFRLCGSDIPDVERITACMARNRAQLSPACRVFFDGGPDEASRAAGRPVDIKPGSSGASVGAKSRKAKKPAKHSGK